MNLYHQFVKTVQAYPDNTCLVDKDVSYTYSEALQKLLYWKNALNLTANSLLAIAIDKSNDYVLCEIAANASGAAFLPLDCSQAHRALDIIYAANPAYILVNKHSTWHKALHDNYRAIVLDDNYILYSQDNGSAYNCSYVIFTSGSTGKPKGILLYDQPVIDVVLQQANIFGIDSASKFAWLLNPAFDASLSDIYATIFSGAALYVANFAMSKIKMLSALVQENQITHTDISPSVLPLIAARQQHFSSLKTIIFGGELASESIVKKMAQNINMFNAYGPTETTICSSVSQVNPDWKHNDIGVPLQGVQYDIVDDQLYIGGNHLAIAYMDDAHNSKFVVHNNQRYYKTGDIVQYVNNSFYYKGRVDRQFKFHGILVCPEEIENAASQCAAVNVGVWFDGSKIHLAYTGTLDKIKLQNILPSYMLPQYYYQYDTLPVNSNGKIDIAALRSIYE